LSSLNWRDALVAAVLAPLYFLPSLSVQANERPPEMVMVLNSRDDSMSLIDPRDYQEVKRVPIGKAPHHLLPTPDGKYLVVANASANDLVLVNPVTGDIEKRIPRIADPYHLGFSHDGRWFVVNGNRLNRVDIYRYNNLDFKIAARLKLPSTPSHMAFAKNDVVYVTLQGTNELVAIDLSTQKVAWKVETGPAPAGVWLTPNGKKLVVAITGADYVQVFEATTGKKLEQFKTGKGAHNFLPLGNGRGLLLSNRVEGSISLIDENTLKATPFLKVKGGPDDMELSADGKELWVTLRWRNRVAVVDMATRKIKKYIKVGRSPHGIYRHDHSPRV
jgi:YVTN family beta-propeller protein